MTSKAAAWGAGSIWWGLRRSCTVYTRGLPYRRRASTSAVSWAGLCASNPKCRWNTSKSRWWALTQSGSSMTGGHQRCDVLGAPLGRGSASRVTPSSSGAEQCRTYTCPAGTEATRMETADSAEAGCSVTVTSFGVDQGSGSGLCRLPQLLQYRRMPRGGGVREREAVVAHRRFDRR